AISVSSSRVSAYPVDTDRIYINRAIADVGDQALFELQANCNPGDFALSGGCLNWRSTAKILQSMPWEGGWFCQWDNRDPYLQEAFSICGDRFPVSCVVDVQLRYSVLGGPREAYVMCAGR